MSQPVASTDLLIKTYKQRWVQLSIFVLFNFSNATLWITYASIATLSSQYYNVSLSDINWLSLVYMVVFIPLGFSCTWLINKHLKYALVCGGFLNCLGAWIRYAAGPNFAWALFGQILAAIAQPFALNSTTKMASTWFPEKERTVANAIMSLCNPIGIAFASILVPALVSVPSDLPIPLLILAIISTFSFILMFLLKRNPETPPSITSLVENISFKQSIINACKHKPFLILALVFGIQVGLFNAISTDIQQILDPYGYTPEDAGYCSAAFILSGLIFAGIIAPFVDKRGNHVIVLKIFLGLLSVLYLAFTLSLHPNLFVLILLINVALGAFTFALLPIALELGVEVTYPDLPEATSNNILWTLGQIFGIIILLVMDQLRIINQMIIGMWLCTAMAIIASIMILFFKGTTKRRAFEEEIGMTSNNKR